MGRKKKLRISAARQIESLISPVRQEILDVVASAGPSSVAEMGTLIGRPADSIYYHVRSLLGVGLLVSTGTRRRGRREERVYDVPADRLLLEYDPADRRNVEAVNSVIASLTRVARRDFTAGFSVELARVKGSRRNLWGARAVGWLDGDQLRRVNEALKEIHDILAAGSPGPGRELIAISWVVAPRKAKDRTRGSAKRGD